MEVLVILLIIIIITTITTSVVMYNNLVKKKLNVGETLSSIQVMLKKRHDAIPDLVATMKHYMKHERKLLEDIVKLREKAINSKVDEIFEIENKLTESLGALNIRMEQYPELKAEKSAVQLQQSIMKIEEYISASRRTYNAAVKQYNEAVQMFPNSIFAIMFGFKSEKYFEIPKEEQEKVNVSNLIGN